MSTYEAIILGLIQGLTEFLPVSSSGHLLLGQAFLGFISLEDYLIFDLICHLGTLLAIFCLFFRSICEMIRKDYVRCLQVFLATLPLFPLAFFLKPIKAVFSQTQYLGIFFLITALLLWLGIRFGSEESTHQRQKKRWRDPLVIGLFQALALLPGVSRSGSTISGARLLGWDTSDAVLFSFLLAIPAILGGVFLETMNLYANGGLQTFSEQSFSVYLAGFVTAFASGLLALSLLIRLAIKNQFMYFVWYCSGLGIFSLVYFNL